MKHIELKSILAIDIEIGQNNVTDLFLGIADDGKRPSNLPPQEIIDLNQAINKDNYSKNILSVLEVMKNSFAYLNANYKIETREVRISLYIRSLNFTDETRNNTGSNYIKFIKSDFDFINFPKSSSNILPISINIEYIHDGIKYNNNITKANLSLYFKKNIKRRHNPNFIDLEYTNEKENYSEEKNINCQTSAKVDFYFNQKIKEIKISNIKLYNPPVLGKEANSNIYFAKADKIILNNVSTSHGNIYDYPLK